MTSDMVALIFTGKKIVAIKYQDLGIAPLMHLSVALNAPSALVSRISIVFHSYSRKFYLMNTKTF